LADLYSMQSEGGDKSSFTSIATVRQI